jgi:hypothetical protein
MVPVLPERVSTVVLPEQIGLAEAVIVPAAETGLTVTRAEGELAEGHTPLVTTTL